MVLKLIAAGILAAVLLINYGSATDFPVTPSEYPNFERNESQQGKYPDGTPVIDPYRSLEELEDPKTKEFIKQEIEFTNKYLEKGSGLRKPIQDRYQQLWKIENYEGPFRKGKKYFSYRNNGSEKQDMLFVQNEPIEDGEVFLNPNNFEAGVTLDKVGSAFSEDGSIFAYLTSKKNSVGKTLQFISVAGGSNCDEKLTEITSITWAKDNKGIFYWFVKSEDSTGLKNYGLRYHEIGTQQSSDKELASFPKNVDFVSSKINDDGKFLVVNGSVGTDENLIYLANVNAIKSGKELEPLVVESYANYEFITNIRSKYIFLTNDDAKNYKLVTVDLNTQSKDWDDLVKENKGSVLDWAAVAGNSLVLGYISDNKSALYVYDAETGKLQKEIKLEAEGAVQAGTFYSDNESSDVYFKFVSFLTPGIIYNCDLSQTNIELKLIKEIPVPNFKREDYVSESVVYKKVDDTELRMHIVHKKSLTKNGKNFAFMTTRGVVGTKNLPYFSVNRVAVADNLNGVHVTVYVRGEGSAKERYNNENERIKPKSAADFVAAAEYLIDNKYTNSELLAVDGGDTGGSGPLMGVVLNERPDLFNTLIAEAGLMDMLRFNKFSNNQKWISEYGSPEDGNIFTKLKLFSPLQNARVDQEDYPATMIVTSINDNRVPAVHSLKFAATLQYQAKQRPAQTNPLILEVSESEDISVKEAVDLTLFIVMNTPGITFRASV